MIKATSKKTGMATDFNFLYVLQELPIPKSGFNRYINNFDKYPYGK